MQASGTNKVVSISDIATHLLKQGVRVVVQTKRCTDINPAHGKCFCLLCRVNETFSISQLGVQIRVRHWTPNPAQSRTQVSVHSAQSSARPWKLRQRREKAKDQPHTPLRHEADQGGTLILNSDIKEGGGIPAVSTLLGCVSGLCFREKVKH